jgi:hypothetical protein
MFRISSRRLLRAIMAVVLLHLALITASGAWAADNWGDAPADLTISEYLELSFKLDMTRPESESLNSYSVVSFYPSSNPGRALVVIIQAWHDERMKRDDLRREIRKVGDAYSMQFESMARLASVRKRWMITNPKANFVVRHVRYSDPRETLGVTINGQTLFDEKEIANAAAEVTARGAVWSW